MRPHKLAMTAFGPFAGTEELDFRRLGEHPLFLINGPTGSGKTTILDAICFALYGQTTGGDRDAREMRSQHAPADLLTEVTLEFGFGERRYRIERTPEQERPKARGEGMTRHAPTAELHEILADGSTRLLTESRKITEANEVIGRLTGLDAEQFRQVMVLPQGKFREFLLADSRKREEIFEQLFQTHIYSDLQDRLKAQAASIRKDRERLTANMEGILKSLEIETEEALLSSIEALKSELEPAQARKDKTAASHAKAQQALTQGQELKSQFDALSDLRGQLSELTAQQEEIDNLERGIARARQAKDIAPRHAALVERQEAVQAAAAAVADAESAMQKADGVLEQAIAARRGAEDRRPDIDRLTTELVELEALRGRVVQLEEASTAAQASERKLSDTQEALELATSAAEQAGQQQTEARKACDDARDALALLPKTEVAVERLQNRLAALSRRRSLAEEIAELQDQRSKLSENLADAGRQLEAAQSERHGIERAWQQGQSARLVEVLVEGEPCPVCGSTHHPSPAPGDPDAPDDEALENARTAEQQAVTLRQQLESQLLAMDANLDQQASALSELDDSAAAEDGQSAEDLESSLGDQQAGLDKLRQLERDLPSLEATLRGAEARTTETKALLDRAAGEAAAAGQAHASAATALQLASNDVPDAYRAAGALDAALTERAEAKAQLESALKAAVAAADAAGQSHTAAKTRLAGLREQLATAEQSSADARSDWQQALQSSAFDSQQDYEAAYAAVERIEADVEQVETFKAQLERIRGAIANQEQSLEGRAAPDIDALTDAERVAAEAAQAASNIFHQLEQKVQTLQGSAKTLANTRSDRDRLDKQYEITGTLSDVSNGRNSRNLSLQRFVLSVLLDDVLNQASVRLRRMSQGRYDLCRDQDVKGRSAAGLELEVLDAYTGGSRRASTLSGGESFMAALALALGLSDVVQAYSGGIRLDTLFIDEGFGSLDAESLDLAVNTLVDLREGGRMVGIISHVDELKERIDVRVDLESGRSGSKIHLRV